jgi:hypothetical protein
MHVFLGGAQEMDFMEVPPFGEKARCADRNDAALSWAKLIEDEAAAEAE